MKRYKVKFTQHVTQTCYATVIASSEDEIPALLASGNVLNERVIDTHYPDDPNIIAIIEE